MKPPSFFLSRVSFLSFCLLFARLSRSQTNSRRCMTPMRGHPQSFEGRGSWKRRGEKPSLVFLPFRLLVR
ncbi:hypothetical protein CSUI_000640 [Cystoisospora suis]|uniref:Secreted protein n=1 Tax=Cystoisospora suis TaxID=483139 RepID=A0A2C6KNC2_9APIC|nr:hypothetical protein CSUI_000640 [Cystoisospora suis]